MTSLASSSEDTNPRIPLIQDMRSLETRSTEEWLLRYLASRPSAQEKRELHNSYLRGLLGVNLVNVPNGARSRQSISKLLVCLIEIIRKEKLKNSSEEEGTGL